jgi:hypothetical protein
MRLKGSKSEKLATQKSSAKRLVLQRRRPLLHVSRPLLCRTVLLVTSGQPAVQSSLLETSRRARRLE